MPKFKVFFAKTIWYSAEVEAENEDAALEAAHQDAPSICAGCSGWRQKWSVSDDDDWRPLDEHFGESYDPSLHGQAVEAA